MTPGKQRGIRWNAVMLGWAAALLLGVILTPLLRLLYRAAAPLTEGVEVTAGSVVVALTAGFASYVVGGYLAARMARHSGGVHGLLTAVFGLVLGVALALLLAGFGVIFTEGVALPPVGFGVGSAGLIAGLILFAINLMGGYVGGKLGDPVR